MARRAARGRTRDGALRGGPEGTANESRMLQEQLGAIDPSASVSSVASAAKVGELFQYTVGNVSLRARRAMIPVVTDDVQVERLSIYNQSVLPQTPLNSAPALSGKHLLVVPSRFSTPGLTPATHASTTSRRVRSGC